MSHDQKSDDERVAAKARFDVAKKADENAGKRIRKRPRRGTVFEFSSTWGEMDAITSVVAEVKRGADADGYYVVADEMGQESEIAYDAVRGMWISWIARHAPLIRPRNL